MESLQTKLNTFYKLRSEVDVLQKKLRELKEKKDVAQKEVLEEFRLNNLKSLSTPRHRFTVTLRKDLKIDDEHKVIAWLKENGLEGQIYEKVMTELFKPTAREYLENYGEPIPGTILSETESLSVTKK